MNVKIFKDTREIGKASGAEAAALIRNAIQGKGSANIILATGASQFETLKQLIAEEDIDWSKVTMFHLDEYIGLPVTHNASFRKYLQERFLSKVPALKAAYLVNGETDAQAECDRLGTLIKQHPIDVAMVGIGENGHLAFNDPPANFDTDEPYIVVELDELCRRQQMGEGWFATIDDVPRKAISMSVKQIMKSKHIICSVPDNRKAAAVKNTLEQDVSNLYPASILQRHANCSCYLDEASSALVSPVVLDRYQSLSPN
ncbi:MAG TPA: glucosamine-6-phosphate deaminase [Agriterribacter sp.]|nr:glucosamine-6-phosphate deaminase [Agriterribacter sp.]